MDKTFKALLIEEDNGTYTNKVVERNIDDLPEGDLLIKVSYSSLNYKDALILNNGGKIVRKFPFVPGIDFSGKVIESEDSKFKKDDNVILTGFRVGEAYFGGFAQYAKVDSNFLIKIPKDLDTHNKLRALIFPAFQYPIVNGKEVEEEMLGSVIIEHKGCDVGVGSGFDQEERRKYFKNPELIIGKTITVQYFEETINQDGCHSLRFPVVKHIYENGRNV